MGHVIQGWTLQPSDYETKQLRESTVARGCRRRAGEDRAAGVTILLAGAVRLADVSRLAEAAGGYDETNCTWQYRRKSKCFYALIGTGDDKRLNDRRSLG